MARPQFQIRHLMLGVLGCALLAAGLRAPEEWRTVFLVIVGPGFGSLIHQSMGGRGILGGAIGGGVFGFGFAVFAYFGSMPVSSQLLGSAIGIPLLTALFTAIGLVVGALIWGLRIQIEDRDARYPWWSPPTPSGSAADHEDRDD